MLNSPSDTGLALSSCLLAATPVKCWELWCEYPGLLRSVVALFVLDVGSLAPDPVPAILVCSQTTPLKDLCSRCVASARRQSRAILSGGLSWPT